MFLQYAVDSALAQTWRPLEIIIIDDASTDETSALVNKLYGANPIVKYTLLEKNQGQYVCTRLGVEKAIGDVVAFLDSDDVWQTNHLQVASDVFSSQPDSVAVLTQRGQIDAKGNVIKEIVPELFSGTISDVLLKRVIFHPSRLVIRRDTWFKLKENTTPRIVGDYFHGVCLIHDYGDHVHLVPVRTVWMRVHSNQSFHNARQLKESLLQVTDKIFLAFPDLRSYEGLVRAANLFHASYFFWVANDWGESWQTLWEGIRSYPEAMVLRDFWITLSRIVLPPSVRRWVRGTR